MKKILILILAISMIGINSSFAVPIVSSDGTEGLGSFLGDFNFSFTDDSNAQIIVSLTNTSPAENGGYFVAFAFNNPFNLITSASLTSTNPNFSILSGDIDTNPYGTFDLGSSISDAWLGGGRPLGGIRVGETASFTFDLVGSGFLNLSNDDFFASGSSDEEWLVARFKGFNDGGSDKVPGTAPVPEPATMILLGAGLIGLAGASRKKILKRG
jgi:hypothetical protein